MAVHYLSLEEIFSLGGIWCSQVLGKGLNSIGC